MNRCICGQTIESTISPDSCYQEEHYRNGKLIYAVCLHGIVIVDERNLVDDIIHRAENEYEIFRNPCLHVKRKPHFA